MERDTICAIATAPGMGGISIVRASGKKAKDILEACFRPMRAGALIPRRMTYGMAVGEAGEELDEVLAVWLPSPGTYTREEMFEIQCHGGSLCARRVLKRIIALGARIAEPGEFTRRAFLNGRIDLSRAEAVMALIGANSEAAARASLRQLEGGISNFVKHVSGRLKDCMARIEASIDFPEEVDESDATRLTLRDLAEIRDEIERHCDLRSAQLIREGASIVLAGRPNVGKSSLMNALLRQERAIVTAVPGTTRDVLTERITLGGVCAQLSDTAGQRQTSDPVESIGVERAERAVERADIVILVLDASEPLTDEDEKMLKEADERTVVCLNKCDIPRRCEYTDALALSAVTGEGLDALLRELEDRLSDAVGEEEKMTEERHLRLARQALDAIGAAEESIRSNMPLDLAEIDLRRALEALAEITGEDASEEVINRVFQNFCVGK